MGDFRNQVITSVWSEQTKIQASDKQGGDRFAAPHHSVSISSDGNTALVGADSEDTGGDSAGAAYIFTRSGTTWTQQQKIQASDKQQGDSFGYGVSISSDGNTALVGAYSEGTVPERAGAAYIFTRSGTTWTQQAKIQASDKQAFDYFGVSVSISSDGNTALVGAYGEDTVGATNAGAAYIFTRSGTSWTQQQKIQASDKSQEDIFGFSVAISGDGNTALVGAMFEDLGGTTNAGAAYIFTRSGTTWTQQQKIQASDPETNDFFSRAVSISSDGNTTIVGAYRRTYEAGVAYIFTRSGTTWTQQAKIMLSGGQVGDEFGWSVSISSDGNSAIVGADRKHTGAVTDTGAAYIFTRSGTTWTQQQKIQASDAVSNHLFGSSVAISSDGNTALVGAEGDSTGGTGAGAAYIFENSYYI